MGKDRGKLTSVKITTSVSYLENAILESTKLTRTAFHRLAIDKFLQGDHYVDDDLLITVRTHPRYIKKPIMERVYLDDERRVQLEKIAKEKRTGITILIFQAIMDYCIEKSEFVPQEVLSKLI